MRSFIIMCLVFEDKINIIKCKKFIFSNLSGKKKIIFNLCFSSYFQAIEVK